MTTAIVRDVRMRACHVARYIVTAVAVSSVKHVVLTLCMVCSVAVVARDAQARVPKMGFVALRIPALFVETTAVLLGKSAWTRLEVFAARRERSCAGKLAAHRINFALITSAASRIARIVAMVSAVRMTHNA